MDETEDRSMPFWKKFLFTLATLSLLLGLGLKSYGALQGSDGNAAHAAGQGSGSSALVAGAEASGSSGSAGQDAESAGKMERLQAWSPTFLKLGFSFFIGVAVGYALRTFFKFGLVAVGAIALAIFGLSYMGLLEVDWVAIESRYDALALRLREEISSLAGFAKGSLPSAALGGLGLFAGLKRG